MQVIEEEVIEDKTWDDLFEAWGEFGRWKKTRRNGYQPHHRRLRIGVSNASNLEGQVVFCYLDIKNPKSCAVIRFPLIKIERLIAKHKKSQLVKQP